MANTIKPKRSETTGNTPTLSPGEMAVNIADKKVWVANSSGTPVLIIDGNATVNETDPVFTASDAFSITTADITNWNTAYGWGDHASAGYLTTETDPVFSASAAFSITTTDTGNWNTAYGWGDHSAAGYLTSETDPVFSVSTAAGITGTDTTNWNTAYGWGDHSIAGYLTTETDPVFSASTAASITSTDTGNWNTAYGWGDHSTAGYLTTETDPTFTASAAYSITSTDTTNWNTAYGWGDHSAAGYLTSETDPVFTASDAASITATDISNWNAKPDTVTVTSTGATITVTDNTVGSDVSFNVETPQGIATTDSPTFAGLTAAGLVYPSADGTAGQVMVTDGSGNISFSTVSVSAALDDLTDVTITTVSNGDILKYNSTSSHWENVAIDSDGISEGTTNLYYTDARARLSLSAGTGISYDSSTGEISSTGGGGTPGGSNKELQFNNSGTLDGTSEILYYDNSIYILSINQTAYNLTPLTIRAASSPSANLMHWLRVDNTIYGGISNFGELFLEYGTPLIFKGNIANNSNYIQLQAPANIPNATIFTLPNGDGTSGQVLKTDGSGQLSFTSVIGNLSGGSGGSIPYQSGASTTAMLANGTSGQILKANGGTSAPSWVSTVSGLTITGLRETKTAPAISSGTLTLDCSSGNVFAVSLNANITTLSFTNVPTTGTAFGLTLMLTADGTARTITWGGAVKWAGGTAPTLTSTNAKVDVYVLVTHDGGTNWYAFTSGQNL